MSLTGKKYHGALLRIIEEGLEQVVVDMRERGDSMPQIVEYLNKMHGVDVPVRSLTRWWSDYRTSADRVEKTVEDALDIAEATLEAVGARARTAVARARHAEAIVDGDLEALEEALNFQRELMRGRIIMPDGTIQEMEEPLAQRTLHLRLTASKAVVATATARYELTSGAEDPAKEISNVFDVLVETKRAALEVYGPMADRPQWEGVEDAEYAEVDGKAAGEGSGAEEE